MTVLQCVQEAVADAQTTSYYPPTTLLISINLWEKLLFEIFSNQSVVFTVPDSGDIKFLGCKVYRIIEPDYLRAF